MNINSFARKFVANGNAIPKENPVPRKIFHQDYCWPPIYKWNNDTDFVSLVSACLWYTDNFKLYCVDDATFAKLQLLVSTPGQKSIEAYFTQHRRGGKRRRK